MGQELALMTWRAFVRRFVGRACDGTPEDGGRQLSRRARLVFRQPPFVCDLTQSCGLADWFTWIRVHAPGKERVLYFHGGAYLSGSGRTHRGMLARIAKLSGVQVCAPDYRLLQEAPFPAAFDDAVRRGHL